MIPSWRAETVTIISIWTILNYCFFFSFELVCFFFLTKLLMFRVRTSKFGGCPEQQKLDMGSCFSSGLMVPYSCGEKQTYSNDINIYAGLRG